ncbi:porin family protein [Salinimicrobium gaetbulicola]|uniref:Porin family protein n=1 Tax=Salinimicrobium gaetbulicola TaxID=999702 RepID=A0ABW3IBD2_9FLAO
MWVFPCSDLEFGAKAGVNFATVDGEDTGNIDGKTGFHLGLVAEIPISNSFAFQPEILYSSQGAKSKVSDTYMNVNFSTKEDLTFDYINIPLLAKYAITPGLSLHAGPQVGFLVNAKDEYEYVINGEKESGTEDMKDEIKNFDFAIAAGLSYKLEMGIFFNARYNAGLSNIIDDDGSSEDYNIHNNVFQLSVGFMF